MHPTPPVPDVNVADTGCPSHMVARPGVFISRVGPAGCGFISHVARVTQSVPVHPAPAVQPVLCPRISTLV